VGEIVMREGIEHAWHLLEDPYRFTIALSGALECDTKSQCFAKLQRFSWVQLADDAQIVVLVVIPETVAM
jgi:hypothetical protein